MITCFRTIEWDAGHRVHGHEGKCAMLHGHRYKAELTAEVWTGRGLDSVGRVVDFSVLKGCVGGWVEENWDHRMLLFKDDLAANDPYICDDSQGVVFLPFNPTAENLADHLLNVVGPKQLGGTAVRLVKVVLWETPNCGAVAALDEEVE